MILFDLGRKQMRESLHRAFTLDEHAQMQPGLGTHQKGLGTLG